MNLNKRLHQLEEKNNIAELPPIETTYVSSPEQVNHPERFRRVLESESISESGALCRVHNLERL